jgi:uncharacterized protein YnzC (UPF0291/DUF896 family)
MDKKKLDRINELARKAKKDGLEAHEKEEQHILRQEYLSEFRERFRARLDNIDFVDEEGRIIRRAKHGAE